ncbi:hypothetical protein OAA60_03015 [Porticoccaceae bacterium]|nr:hypothetical protein [Porticoccaceae bacterium]
MQLSTPRSSDWIDVATADNAAATATKAAAGGGISHYVTSISGGYSSTKSGLTLILKNGTVEMGRWYVYDSKEIVFDSPIKLPPNTVANLVLAASGTGGHIGSAVMTGYSI